MATPRYLCSELVRLVTDGRGQWVNLEEIWAEGAVLACEEEVGPGAPARISTDEVSFEGAVTAVERDEFGWRVEIAFSADTPWSIERWRPEHALDPDSLNR